jgi:CRP-like cAMP-binding protein
VNHLPDRESRLAAAASAKHSPNRLLAALPDAVYARLQPRMRLVEYALGQVLAETGAPIEDVYFPHTGIISLVVELKVGDMIETAMVGRDGSFNAASALDGKVSLNKAICQMKGVASVLSADDVAEISDQHREFRTLLIRHEQILFAQSQQSGACNASHLVEARMCRWLLRMRDLAGSDDLVITQEFLGQLLGVRRSSVSIVANTLQKAGLIQYRRGRIRIVNVDGLQEASCECYETVRGHYERLLYPDK